MAPIAPPATPPSRGSEVYQVLSTWGLKFPIFNLEPGNYRFPDTGLKDWKIAMEGTNHTLLTQAIPRKKMYPAVYSLEGYGVVPQGLAALLALGVYFGFAMHVIQ